MSLDTKDVTQGVVSTISDDALVMVAGSGGWSPISFADLAKAVRGTLQIGGRNLLLCEVKPSSPNVTFANNIVTFNANADIYFYIKVAPSANLKIGETYTLSFDCEGLKAGNSWVLNGVINARCFNINLANGRNKVTFVMNQLQLGDGVWFMFDDGARFFPNGFTPVTLSNFKLERGNIATEWTPAPEDLASGAWGGVNQRFTTTYKSEDLTEILFGDCLLTVREKGGAHEPADERPDNFSHFRIASDSHSFKGVFRFRHLSETRSLYSDCGTMDKSSKGSLQVWCLDCVWKHGKLYCPSLYYSQPTPHVFQGILQTMESEQRILEALADGDINRSLLIGKEVAYAD